MKRTLKFLAVILILFSLFSVNAFADEGEDILEEFSGILKLPRGKGVRAVSVCSQGWVKSRKEADSIPR